MEHCLLLPHDHRIRHFGNSSVSLEEQMSRTNHIMKSWKSCIYGSLSTFRRWQIAVQQSFSTMYANLHDFLVILKNSYPELVQTPSNYINMWHLKFSGSLTTIVRWRWVTSPSCAVWKKGNHFVIDIDQSWDSRNLKRWYLKYLGNWIIDGNS